MTKNTLRLLDVLFAGIGLLMLSPLLAILLVLTFWDTGKPLLFQERVGRQLKPFLLIKFRTMRLDTPHVASHMTSSAAITPLGRILRRTKLDELPQFWNVLLGHMSLVGPRPSLYNQYEIIQARIINGVYAARPGITGLAQINRIDMSTPDLLAKIDAHMIRELTIVSYFKYIFLTLIGKGTKDTWEI